QAPLAGGAHAALGDQRRDQPRRRDVEGGIGGQAALGQHVNRDDLAARRAAGDAADLGGGALFDRYVTAVFDRPIDAGVGQADIERHAVVVRGQRLEIGADLVADI